MAFLFPVVVLSGKHKGEIGYTKGQPNDGYAVTTHVYVKFPEKKYPGDLVTKRKGDLRPATQDDFLMRAEKEQGVLL